MTTLHYAVEALIKSMIHQIIRTPKNAIAILSVLCYNIPVLLTLSKGLRERCQAEDHSPAGFALGVLLPHLFFVL